MIIVAALVLGAAPASAAPDSAGSADPGARVGPGVYLADAASFGQSGEPNVDASGSDARQPRIVGGTPINISQAPWQTAFTLSPAVFQGTANQRHFCGGSLVSPTVVITAAHCVFNEDATGFNFPPNELAMITGRTTLSSAEGQELQVSNFFVFTDGQGFPLYDPRTGAWDVAVVQLEQASTTGVPIQLAGLDETELWAKGRAAFVSGWGHTREGGPGSDTLLSTDIVIQPNNRCESVGAFDRITSICAGLFAGERDACQGDSGGPLVAPTVDGGARLIGDVQSGVGCARGRSPGTYGRFGADPVQSALRDTVLQLAGVNIVGSGAQPPTTFTSGQPIELSVIYAEDQCDRWRLCRAFGVGNCKPRGVGFRCKVTNFAKSRNLGKFRCDRTILWTIDTGVIRRQNLSKWECRR